MSAELRFLRLVLVFGWTIGSLCESDVPAAHTVYDKLSIQRNLSKRELKCEEGEYPAENICCKKCAPGSFKQADCTKVNNTTCVQCEEGSTFMDYPNYYLGCRRCGTCDTKLGLEVAEQCTITQNTKCKCAQDHFCNSSVPCRHCDPCDKCENGEIEKACTLTTNTICKTKGNFWWIYLVVGIIIAIPSLSVIAVCCYKKRWHNFDLNKQKLDQDVHKPYTSVEMEPLMYTVPDVDLSTHVPAIVEEMTLPQVKSFVRKYEIPEPAIEQILQDHSNDSAEQKIKLFHVWYQMHGMKGAYGNLMSSLRELKMRAVADKIEKKMNAVTSSTQENGKSNVKTAEQSSAHSDGYLAP
ncbi:tumor necrosis factor receptor superfamily member 6 isoform X2 [Emydura macquarii macquarii]|uniref:tumor necrosis factor receptor superfamily member 6 isoform X2 n=1 Tax=Emydura macquarii macquarii TaxID=1129001 RepID=UPI00352B3EE1